MQNVEAIPPGPRQAPHRRAGLPEGDGHRARAAVHVVLRLSRHHPGVLAPVLREGKQVKKDQKTP